MRYKLIISEEAHQDIDDTVQYIARALKNPQAAIRFLEDVETAYQQLVDNPEIYALCKDDYLREKGYRMVVMKHYLLFFRIVKDTQTAYIVRSLYGGRDYAKLL